MHKIKIPIHELSFSYSRSGGPGGQNVNKVNTKATLQWNVLTSNALPFDVHQRFVKKYQKKLSEEGVISIVSQKYRSQTQNTEDAISKLHEMIESVAIAPKERKKTKPSKSAINKRLNQKKVHSDKKKSRQEKY